MIFSKSTPPFNWSYSTKIVLMVPFRADYLEIHPVTREIRINHLNLTFDPVLIFFAGLHYTDKQ